MVNSVRSKMESYGDRLRQLIAEAYQEGIVLTVPEAKDDGLLLPLLESQKLYSLSAPVPTHGFIHLNLKPPSNVTVKCVVKNDAEEEIVSSVKAPLP